MPSLLLVWKHNGENIMLACFQYQYIVCECMVLGCILWQHKIFNNIKAQIQNSIRNPFPKKKKKTLISNKKKIEIK